MGNLRIGIALGSGSARGWAHIGVIRALAEIGIEPDIICGSSIGSLVGGAHAAGQLDLLEEWVTELTMWDVVRLMDIRLAGGLIEGNTLMASINGHIKGISIEALLSPFAAVATDLANGREVWLQQGSLADAIRARYKKESAGLELSPLDQAIVRVDVRADPLAETKRAIMTDLDRLSGRIALKSVDAQAATDAVVDIVQRAQDLLQQVDAAGERRTPPDSK